MSGWHLPGAGLTCIGILAGIACAQTVPDRDLIVNDPSVLAYVQRVKHRLTGSGGGRTLEIRITRGTEMYASLRPPDVLHISGALFERLESEAELAGLLAHQLAHLRPQGHIKPSCVLGSQIIRSDGGEEPRESEMQATDTALRTLRLAGYDPSAILDLLSKLAYEHPTWAKAIVPEDLLKLRADLESDVPPAGGYLTDSSAFAEQHKKVAAQLESAATDGTAPSFRVLRKH